MIELWDFQGWLADDLREAICAGRRAPLLVAPTGSGKTIIFSWLAGRMAGNGLNVTIAVHRKELLDQVCDTLDMAGTPYGCIRAGTRYVDDEPVQVVSILSVIRRLEVCPIPDYLIIDEGHHAVEGSTWAKCIEYWRARNPNFRIIGVTATPERLGGEGLHKTFDQLVLGPSTRELIDAGYLSEYDMFGPPRPIDTRSVRIQGGDYARGETAALMDKPKITGDAVTHYHKHLQGRPAIAFCVSVEHTRNVAESFRQAGYRAESVDGGMKHDERERIINLFRAGRLNVLTSCDLISEGFDVPGAFGAILLRPTESLALYLQQCGRVLRTFEGKERAVILDHVGNSGRHGLPCIKRQWTLLGRKRLKRRDPDDIQIRQCPMCGGVSPISAMECRECGYNYPTKARTIEQVDGELEQIKYKQRWEFKSARRDAKDLESLIAVGRAKGMKNPEGWAKHVMEAREKKKTRRLRI